MSEARLDEQGNIILDRDAYDIPLRPRISVCMMVRDGGDLFRQALESVRDIADEIIVYNTDPDHKETPDTAAARAAGAVIFYEPWRSDFSFHRNQTLDAATGDWVFVFDADERFHLSPALSPDGFRQWLGSLPEEVSAVHLPHHDMRGDTVFCVCNQYRFFRRGRVHYEHAVHNRECFQGATVFCALVSIQHFGYEPEFMMKKFETRRAMLLEQLEKPAENRDTLLYLSQLHGMKGIDRYEEAVEYGEAYLAKHKKIGAGFRTHIFKSLARMHMELGNYDRARTLLYLGFRHDPKDPDLAVHLSDLGWVTGNLALEVEGAKRFDLNQKWHCEHPDAIGNAWHFSLGSPTARAIMYRRLAMGSIREGVAAWQHLMGKNDRLDARMEEIARAFQRMEAELFQLRHERAVNEQREERKKLGILDEWTLTREMNITPEEIEKYGAALNH